LRTSHSRVRVRYKDPETEAFRWKGKNETGESVKKPIPPFLTGLTYNSKIEASLFHPRHNNYFFSWHSRHFR